MYIEKGKAFRDSGKIKETERNGQWGSRSTGELGPRVQMQQMPEEEGLAVFANCCSWGRGCILRIKPWVWQCRRHWWLWKESFLWNGREKNLIAGVPVRNAGRGMVGSITSAVIAKHQVPKSRDRCSKGEETGRPWRSFSGVSRVLLSPEREERKLRGNRKTKETLTYQVIFPPFFSKKEWN